jgi:multiple sugar transport system permease protein
MNKSLASSGSGPQSGQRSPKGHLTFHLLAGSVSLIFLLPFVWMIYISLQAPGVTLPRGLEGLSLPNTWHNYARIFELLPLGRYLFNSLLVAGLAVPLTLITSSWAGFALAQLSAHWRRRLILLSIGALLAPLTALWLTHLLLFTWLGLINTYGALLAPALMGSNPLFVLLFYWAFRRIPVEIFESARLDGTGAWLTWRLIALPQVRPALFAIGVLTFLSYWGDFIHPLLYLKSQALYTLPLGLRQLQQLDQTQWPLLMAGAVVMTLPPVLLFLVVQHYFLQARWFSSIEQ